MKQVTALLLLLLSFGAFAQEGVNWITMEEAYALSKKNPKPILVDVYTDWCGWCKKMDKDTYAKESVYSYINENYYAVKFNAEQKESITILDHTFKFVAQGRRGYHELAAALLNGKMSYPSTVFLTGSFEMIQNVPGYQNEQNMLPILVYLGEGKYKELPFEEFLSNYNQKTQEP